MYAWLTNVCQPGLDCKEGRGFEDPKKEKKIGGSRCVIEAGQRALAGKREWEIAGGVGNLSFVFSQHVSRW